MTSEYETTCQRTGNWLPSYACERECNSVVLASLSLPGFWRKKSKTFLSRSLVQRWTAVSPVSQKTEFFSWCSQREERLCTKIRSSLNAVQSTTPWRGMVIPSDSITLVNHVIRLAQRSSSFQTRTLAVLMVNGYQLEATQRCRNARKVNLQGSSLYVNDLNGSNLCHSINYVLFSSMREA